MSKAKENSETRKSEMRKSETQSPEKKFSEMKNPEKKETLEKKKTVEDKKGEEPKDNSYVRLPWFGLKKLGPYLAPYKRIMISMIVLGLFGSSLDIVVPQFQSYALDNFVEKGTLEGLGIFIAIYAAVILIQTIVNTISTYQTCQIEMYVGRDMKQSSFDHLQTLSFSYFNQNSVGYVHARVMSDTDRIGSWIAWGLMDGIWNLSYLIGVVLVMFWMNARLAAFLLFLVPVTVVLASYFQKKLVRFNRTIREINSRVTGNYNEGITGAKTIKSMVIEDKMQENFEAESENMRHTSVHMAHYQALFLAVMSFAASVALALVLWKGGVITAQGVMEIGTLSVFMSYALGMIEPIQWIIRALSSLVSVQVNIERFSRLMETGTEVADSPEVIERYGDVFHPKMENWEPLHGDVEFRDVSFHYPDGEEMIFEHFNLKVPQGTNVAIVGETGAGKSTLVNLLCRFFEPTEGQILIDGRDVRERSQLWLHRNLGYVIQTPHLFSGSIAENLRYAKQDATLEEMQAAMKAVAADSIPERMEHGYDSEVGEGGDLLSTGEKQLISFARAVLADPRIFVLDEATSSIDTVTEKKIQDATELLLHGRTSFIIAHRLSTIRQADVILMVEGGKVIEKGTHEQLMQKKGAYYRLYSKQYSMRMPES